MLERAYSLNEYSRLLVWRGEDFGYLGPEKLAEIVCSRLFLTNGVDKSYIDHESETLSVPPLRGRLLPLIACSLEFFMKTNIKESKPIFTHEGGPSSNVSALDQLKRSVMACMLWEDNFYEDGKSIVDRIEELCKNVHKAEIMALALNSFSKGYLRHVPLKLIVEALKHRYDPKRPDSPNAMAHCINLVCNRPDQMTELLSLYWKDGKKPLAAQLKKGLSMAFTHFDEYQLAKYNRDGKIKLRDVLFLCHAKPKDKEQEEVWKRLIDGNLKTPDTWETRLSAGESKEKSFTDLLMAGKMGKLAILRNLRNMFEANVPKDLVEHELMESGRPILPFQFLTAAAMCPQWEDIVDKAMLNALKDKPKMLGLTVIFVDVSGSMAVGDISNKGVTKYIDAACGLAILTREICVESEIWTFANSLNLIPPRHGMALRDAIHKNKGGGTYLGAALNAFNAARNERVIDRIIVITDEQIADTVPAMKACKNCYILNVSNCQNGIKNVGNQWLTINGFSEASIDYIMELEKGNANNT